MREETGYDVSSAGCSASTRSSSRRRSGPWTGTGFYKGVRVIFEATVVGGELRNEVDGTTDEARWFTLSEVAGLARVDLVDIGLRMLTA